MGVECIFNGKLVKIWEGEDSCCWWWDCFGEFSKSEVLLVEVR